MKEQHYWYVNSDDSPMCTAAVCRLALLSSVPGETPCSLARYLIISVTEVILFLLVLAVVVFTLFLLLSFSFCLVHCMQCNAPLFHISSTTFSF